MTVQTMGLFDKKSSIIGAALGVGGAFDKSRKTDTAAAFGTALGASIAIGQKWTMEDSLRLGDAISALDAAKLAGVLKYIMSYDYHKFHNPEKTLTQNITKILEEEFEKAFAERSTGYGNK